MAVKGRLLWVCWLVATVGCDCGGDAMMQDDDGGTDVDEDDGGGDEDGDVISSADASDALGGDGGSPWAGWKRFEWLPDGCDVYHPVNIERSVPRLSWAPCFHERAGCQQLVVDWGDWHDDVVTFLPGRVTSNAAPPWLVLTRPAGVDGMTEGVAFDSAGTVLIAWREKREVPGCAVGNHLSLGPWGGAVGVLLIEEDGLPAEAVGRFMVSRPFEVSAVGVLNPGEARDNGVQALFAGRDLTGLDLIPGQIVGRVTSAGFEIVGPPAESPGPSHIRGVVENELFYTNVATDRTRVLVVREDGTNEVYLEGDDFDVPMFRTDGDYVVWGRGYGRSSVNVYERNELWVAPFEPNPDDLDARKLLDLGSGAASSTALRVGSGYAGLWRGEREILLVRLSDAAWWTIEAPAEHRWFGPPRYITADELALVVGRGIEHRTVFRIAIDSLGPPEMGPYTP